jgi:hypothetical protein
VGYQAGYSTTTGTGITAFGYQAAYTHTSTSPNFADTFIGYRAGYLTTTGADLTFVGGFAGNSNTTGSFNTAVGGGALFSNTTGNNNTAVGYQAGYSQTSPANGKNAYFGYQAGYANVTSDFNTYIGNFAGGNATSSNNTFVGSGAGYLVTSGAKNTVLGNYNGDQGGLDIRTASNHIVLSDGDGNPRLFLQADGSLRCLGVYNNAAAASNAVNVDASGNVYRSTSALKYKTNVRDLEDIDINLFRAVRYNSNCAIDNPDQDHFGVIADEVDAAGITELVNYGADGEVEGFQYERLTVVLLKAIQELKAEFDAYKATHP